MNHNPNEASSATHNKLIEAYLLAGNKLTKLEALDMFGCMALNSRIADLRKIYGKAIITEMVATSTGKKVAQYHYDASKANTPSEPKAQAQKPISEFALRLHAEAEESHVERRYLEAYALYLAFIAEAGESEVRNNTLTNLKKLANDSF